MEPLDYLLTENPVIWVFGYGSLLWKHNFNYKSKVVGFIEGYERRFNQGNETFRGFPGKPGRVANLEETDNGKTWGVAYEISGRREVSKVLQDLYVRESRCGGYHTLITTFYPREYARTQADDADTMDNVDCQTLSRSSSSAESTGVKSPLSTDSARVVTSRTDILPCSSHTIIKHDDSKDMNADVPTNGRPVSSSDLNLCHHDNQSSSVTYGEQSLGIDVSKRRSSSFQWSESTVSVVNQNENSKSSYSSKKEDTALPSDDGQMLECQVSEPAPSVFISSSETITTTPYVAKVPANAPNSGHRPVQVLLYTATPDNSLYLGPDSLTNMAHQIVESRGSAGTNVEYVLKIAEYVRKYIPEDDDDHLFGLDAKVREELYRRFNLQRTTGSKVVEKDADLEHHEALLKSIRVRAS